MMPSTSGSLDPGGIDVEAVDSIDGPPPRPTASADDRSNADDRPAADRRVRDDAPAADRDLPEERVRRLADEVAALEAEVAALEAEIESKERQRQQVIDTYESIVRERSAGAELSGEDPTAETEAAATENANGGLLAAVRSRLARLVGRADE